MLRTTLFTSLFVFFFGLPAFAGPKPPANFRLVIGGTGGGAPPNGSNTTNFSTLSLIAYANQGGSGSVTVADNGNTIQMAGNNWVQSEQPIYTITQDTVLEFDFKSTIEGEISGIGFDEDNNLTNEERIFQLFGTQNWNQGIQSEQQYSASDLGTWVHFTIPVGQYYTGSSMHLVLANDHDSSPADGTSYFKNIQLTGTDSAVPPGTGTSDTASITILPRQEVDGYKVYYKTDTNSPSYNGTGLNEGNSPIDIGNRTSYTVTGLQKNTLYHFAVTAYRGNEESGYSEEATILKQ